MRDILFKAKRLSDGEWVEGNIVDVPEDAGFMPGAYILPRLVSARADPPTKGIMLGGLFEVDPSTVCQYTGLTDGNGKRVFEGDVLKFRDEPNDYEWIGRVEFGNPNGSYTWGWQLVHISGPEPNIDTLCWFDMEEGGAYSEVIGSIHDGEGNNVQ